MTSFKTVERIITSEQVHEGGGFLVHRPFPTRELSFLDPFLLLDEMGPAQHGPGEAKGAPDHPHRGFETVTYMLSGEMGHRDSAGHSGVVGPGDVQWMTAGRGVVHSEMPTANFQSHGGLMHGFQIWVNLPKAEKMAAPRYQGLTSAELPTADLPGGRVKVIAGEVAGVSAKVQTHTPILFLDFTLRPGARLEQSVPVGFNSFAYVISGTGDFAGREAKPHELVSFSGDGGTVAVASRDTELRFLLLAGQPLNEPVARYGPFVMNTQAELFQAFADFRDGRMGKIG